MNGYGFCFALTALVLSLSAQAADDNRDGRISQEEARGSDIEQRFEVIDANGDRQLDAAELRYEPERRRNRTGNNAASIDADEDGRLSRAEAANDRYVDAHFEDWDINDDRFLDDGELDNDWAEWDIDSFEAVDLDGDGVIDGDEASESGYVDYNFTRWDLDGDNRLTEQEVNSGWMNEGSTPDTL